MNNAYYFKKEIKSYFRRGSGLFFAAALLFFVGVFSFVYNLQLGFSGIEIILPILFVDLIGLPGQGSIPPVEGSFGRSASGKEQSTNKHQKNFVFHPISSFELLINSIRHQFHTTH